MPQFDPKKKKSFQVLNDPKKNFENAKLHGCTMEGLCATWPHHDAHAMVGHLLMFVQCVFRTFMFFEKYFFRL